MSSEQTVSVRLIQCPACGCRVSSRADSCIHCGDPLTSPDDATDVESSTPIPNHLLGFNWLRKTIYRVTFIQSILALVLATYLSYMLVINLVELTSFSSFAWSAVALAGLYFVLKWCRNIICVWREPSMHPAIMRAAAGTDRSQVIMSLEAELPTPTYNRHGVRVTQNWVLFPTWIRFSPIHVSDLIWAHAKLTTTRLYGVVPISRLNSVVVYDRFGGIHTRETNEDKVQDILRVIHSAAPWAFIGFHDDRQRAFLDPKGRFKLIQEVDERRAKIQDLRRS